MLHTAELRFHSGTGKDILHLLVWFIHLWTLDIPALPPFERLAIIGVCLPKLVPAGEKCS